MLLNCGQISGVFFTLIKSLFTTDKNNYLLLIILLTDILLLLLIYLNWIICLFMTYII